VTALRAEYQQNVRVVGPGDNVNKQLEYALRVDDFMEFADITVRDALDREESCGCHFREEYQTEDGECRRNDEEYAYVAAWEFKGRDAKPDLHKEQLEFKSIELKQRSYK
jgi:succinate dehydrogenase / fumarate reductase flavoprotein subunit